jgi:hypothetical protein
VPFIHFLLQFFPNSNQYRVHIEQFRKNDDGNWLLSESEDQNGILALADGLCQISHRDIYAKVKFDQV